MKRMKKEVRKIQKNVRKTQNSLMKTQKNTNMTKIWRRKTQKKSKSAKERTCKRKKCYI